MLGYSKEQVLELYKSTPQELRDVYDSDITHDTLWSLSEEFKLDNQQHETLIDSIAGVFLGLLPPSDFENALIKGKIKKKDAQEITKTVQRFIFYPVKNELNMLYEEVTDFSGVGAPAEEKETKKKQRKKPEKKDTYRESIE